MPDLFEAKARFLIISGTNVPNTTGHHSSSYLNQRLRYTGWSKKTDTQFYFWDNFGNSAPILTILSLLQAEIYGA